MTEKTMMQHYADMHKTNVEMGESSREPACSTALIIEAGDYELQDDNPDVIWLYHSTGEGIAIPRDEFADYLDALFKQRF